MSFSQAELKIMELATEDWLSLAEVLLEVRAMRPAESEDEQLRLSQSLVRRLLKAGHVRLCLVLPPSTRRIERGVEAERQQKILADAANWRGTWPPFQEPTYAICANGSNAMCEHRD